MSYGVVHKFLKGLSSVLGLRNGSIGGIFRLNLQRCAKTSSVLAVKMVGFCSTNKEPSACLTAHPGSLGKKTCTTVSRIVKVRNRMC